MSYKMVSLSVYALGLFALVGLSISQTSSDLCSRNGGICSYSRCSRYYVSSSSAQLCPSAFQRCCVAELCLSRFGGNCQNSRYVCNGAAYTHTGLNRLCQQSTDSCCISTAPAKVTTTPPPVPTLPVAKSSADRCSSYGGKCAHQTKYRCNNGEFRLLGDKNEILCNNWYSNSERCCMAKKTGVKATPAPTRPTVKPTVPSKPATNSKSACGVQKVSLVNKRIVGGSAAQKGEWPWQTSIIKSTSVYGSSFAHTCGGTLIAPQWVVSAAHCFQGLTNQYLVRVRVGEHSFYVDEGSESNARIDNIIVHPQYIHSQNKNDIALIKLTKPMDTSSAYIGTACLPQPADLPDFYKTSECYTTGWGLTQGTSGDRNVLQEVKSSLVSQRTCYSKWGYKIDSTKVCFGNGYKGACKGDSGGPLVCKKDGRFHLVGVVSYGTKSCTQKYVPTVYTNVAAYKTWIDQVMATN